MVLATVLLAVVVLTAATASMVTLAGVLVVPGRADPRLDAIIRATARGVSVLGACGPVGALVFAVAVVGIAPTAESSAESSTEPSA